ncbi:hypothetical protein [Mesonia maritima]|uniref:Uncharacterized protein n=1 Tax=Mesonia maritima TaxID=1793873 RepID=A0ABU1K624_9FLAO|nr:hypothetical protein [Mesonia maritima]MDR6301064.1 hypothetical protein [Mesonia maritima]
MMIYLIWSLFNLLLFGYFIYLFFGFIAKGRKVFHKKFKAFGVLILSVGILQIITSVQEKENNPPLISQEIDNTKYGSSIQQVNLENNLNFKIGAYLNFKNDSLISASSTLTGFVTGYSWKIKNLDVNREDYTLKGILSWEILGYDVYQQSKTFHGRILN